MTSDQLLTEIHAELLDLHSKFHPVIRSRGDNDPQMIEFLNRVGAAGARILGHMEGWPELPQLRKS